MRTALIVVAIVFATTGCAGGAFSPEDVAQAAQQTLDTGSSRVVITETDRTGKWFKEARATGVWDFEHERAVMRSTQSWSSGKTRDLVLVDGDVAYYRTWPSMSTQVKGAKTWVAQGPVSPLKDMSRAFIALTPFNPVTALDRLKSIGGEVETVGEARIRDVQTTHYRGRIDVQRVVDSEQEEGVKRLLELQVSNNPNGIPVDVWVDDAGVVRRLQEELRFSVPKNGLLDAVAGDLVLTMDFFDFGVPVKVDTPPASDVMTESELLALMEKSG